MTHPIARVGLPKIVCLGQRLLLSYPILSRILLAQLPPGARFIGLAVTSSTWSQDNFSTRPLRLASRRQQSHSPATLAISERNYHAVQTQPTPFTMLMALQNFPVHIS